MEGSSSNPKSRPGTLSQGTMAGVIGATAMALWFLFIDASQGTPFRTPAFLAGAILGQEGLQLSAGAIALYTFIHYGAFVIVGVVTARVMRMLRTVPPVLLGFALGFLLFDLVFYTGVSVTGVNVVTELGWPEVLAGNVLAGVSLVSFVHMTSGKVQATWWNSLVRDSKVLREGLMAGLAGAVVVALWFFAFDLMRGEPLFTPGALGSALFLGARDLSDVLINGGTVAGYTMFHLAAFAGTGVVASALVNAAERQPPVLLGGILLFVCFEAFFMGFLALVAEFLLGPLAWWSIAVGNLLAAVAMGSYLMARHPNLAMSFTRDPMGQTA